MSNWKNMTEEQKRRHREYNTAAKLRRRAQLRAAKQGKPLQRELTPRQLRFLRGLRAGLTMTQAAREAGYSETVARKARACILSNPLLAEEERKIKAELVATYDPGREAAFKRDPKSHRRKPVGGYEVLLALLQRLADDCDSPRILGEKDARRIFGDINTVRVVKRKK
jgi:hypothetical protein